MCYCVSLPTVRLCRWTCIIIRFLSFAYLEEGPRCAVVLVFLCFIPGCLSAPHHICIAIPTYTFSLLVLCAGLMAALLKALACNY